MHREIAEIARSLVSASAQFEPVQASRRSRTLDGLALLAGLEQITRRSLPQAAAAAPPPAPQTASGAGAVQSVPSPAADQPARPAAPRYTSTNSEYRAALGNDEVVEALLKLQTKVRTTQPQARPLAAFQPSQAPRIQAGPKNLQSARRSPGIYHPVLRNPNPGRPK